MSDLDLTEEEILRIVMEESREMSSGKSDERRSLISQQDEEYEQSLERDKRLEEERRRLEEEREKEPKEGDLHALREARLKFFKK